MSEAGGPIMEALPSKLIRVTDRGTISIGGLADHEFYMAVRRTDGSILLEPMLVQPVNRRKNA